MPLPMIFHSFDSHKTDYSDFATLHIRGKSSRIVVTTYEVRELFTAHLQFKLFKLLVLWALVTSLNYKLTEF